MRVLVICSAFPPVVAPESAHARQLCRRLAADGVNVHLLTSVAAGDGAGEPFVVHRVMPGWRWRHLPRLARVWRRVRPDAVLLMYVSWLYGAHPMVTWLPVIRRGLPRARFVTQFENVGRPDNRWTRLQRPLAGRRFDAAFGALLSDSDAVVTLCEPHRAAVGADRAWVIPVPPLIDAGPQTARADGRAELGVGPDDFVVAFFGYVYRGKGVETLLRAAAEVKRVRVVVIGQITDPDYGRELMAVAGRGRVTWLGHCSDERASTMLRAADAAALPFDAGVALNNSSVAVVALHGLPLVTTAGPTLEPAFADAVVLVPPGDPVALATALRRLAGDPAARAAAAAGSARLARDHFSWDNTVRRTLAVLRPPPPTEDLPCPPTHG